MADTSFFGELLTAIADRGRAIRDLAGWGGEGDRNLSGAAQALLSGRGEASGVALARDILERYRGLGRAEKADFFRLLRDRLAPDAERVAAAFEAYRAAPGSGTLRALVEAIEPPRRELVRRLNLAPGGTLELVRMREDLLDLVEEDPELCAVDDDFVHLFISWFNRGFLVLKRIDWTTPANILEKIIAYEAVHEINGWDELRRRIEPPDRRCFAFFHPTLVDEPLIFVEVALTAAIPGSVQALLAADRVALDPAAATTAVFYSISNCQKGLAGVNFGHFLIKQVVEELSRDLRGLRAFVTLSPVPTFREWLEGEIAAESSPVLTSEHREVLKILDGPDWHLDPERRAKLEPALSALAAAYLLTVKTAKGRPRDPVARFHLGNGARLERVNPMADISPKGLSQAAGVMVNYLYDLRAIEANHEAYANNGVVAASAAVRRQARSVPATPAPVPA